MYCSHSMSMLTGGKFGVYVRRCEDMGVYMFS